MRFIQFLFIFFLSISLSANAQKNKNKNNTLLWEISGKDLVKPSYLFGTYHFADKGFVDTMKVLNDKLRSVDAIVGELVMDSSMSAKLAPYMLMKNNFLENLLTASEYKLVDDYLKKVAGYNLKMFNSFKPMAVQITLLSFIAPITFTKDNPPIDEFFQTYAKASNKPIYAFETAEEQGELIFGASLERQKELLINSIKEERQNKKTAQNLYQYYIKQDLVKLEKLFTANKDMSSEETDKMLKNRNIKWVEKLPTLMQNKSLFIAVGAGHLVGKDGLLTRLRAQGYIVKPIATN